MRYFFFVLVCFFIDIFIKDKIKKDYLKIKNKKFKYISLNRVYNKGFIFGKCFSLKKLVKYLPVFFLILLSIKFYILIKTRDKVYKILSFALIIAGGLSNIRDRFKYSYVIDYFSFNYKIINNIVFNLADIYIIFGSLLYNLGGFIFG